MGGPSDEGRKRLLLQEALNAGGLYGTQPKCVKWQLGSGPIDMFRSVLGQTFLVRPAPPSQRPSPHTQGRWMRQRIGRYCVYAGQNSGSRGLSSKRRIAGASGNNRSTGAREGTAGQIHGVERHGKRGSRAQICTNSECGIGMARISGKLRQTMGLWRRFVLKGYVGATGSNNARKGRGAWRSRSAVGGCGKPCRRRVVQMISPSLFVRRRRQAPQEARRRRAACRGLGAQRIGRPTTTWSAPARKASRAEAVLA